MFAYRIAFALALIGLSFPPPVAAQDPAEEAQARLDYLAGTWDSTTEVLDADGTVIQTDRSVNLIEPWISDKVILTTVITAQGNIRKTIRFYDQREARYYEIGVGEAGDVWILTGGLDEYVTTSQERSSPNGGGVKVRFTHTNIQPNSFEAFMEVSRDGGESWTRSRTRERLVRRTAEHK